jgi:hypothetical protein
MPQLTRITRDPAVMGGKPCIRGMRVTVGTVVGLVAAGQHGTRFSANILTSTPRTSPRHCPTPLGGRRKSKCRCASREAARGHEPVAKLGRPAGAPRVRGCPLVHYRGSDRAGLRNSGVGERAWLRRHHERLDFSAILAASARATPSVVQIRTQDLLSDEVVSTVVHAPRSARGTHRAWRAPLDRRGSDARESAASPLIEKPVVALVNPTVIRPPLLSWLPVPGRSGGGTGAGNRNSGAPFPRLSNRLR